MNTQKKVKEIPGNILNSTRYSLNGASYSGYVESDNKHKDNLFYWFFSAGNAKYVKDPESIPIIMWLNGGPGYSSLAGLITENGPFLITRNDTGTIVQNNESWNQTAHLLYWDQPVGTGYSYSGKNHFVNSEIELGKQMYNALQGFYNLHPEYRTCPLYITGESYAGKYVPNIATEIMQQNSKVSKSDLINLQGIAIGDGWMKPSLQLQCQIDYAYQLGFIDTRQKSEIENKYKSFLEAYNKGDMKSAYSLGNSISNSILNCGGNLDIYDVRCSQDDSDDLLKTYFNSKDVKTALGVPESVIWQCADDVGPVSQNLIDDNMSDVTILFKDLISNYRVLFYTGNFDMSCGFSGTEQILQEPGITPYKKWSDVKRMVWVDSLGKVLGYYKSLENLTQITIPYAGHMVPMDNAQAAYDMIVNWVNKNDFMTYLPKIGL